MINILEAITTYNDDWQMTFYYIAVLVILGAIFWTYMQIFVFPLVKRKIILKENIIYQHPEDIIENYDEKEKLKKIKKSSKKKKKESKKSKINNF